MLLTSTIMIPVEVLNQHGETISRAEARLIHLHGDCAVLHFPQEAPQTLIHWGSLLRFWISDGPFGYEIDGVVVAHKMAQSLPTSENQPGTYPDSEEDEDPESFDHLFNNTFLPSEMNSLVVSEADLAQGLSHENSTPLVTHPSESEQSTPEYREVTVKLVHSRPFAERRTGPRRWKRFSVRFHELAVRRSSGVRENGVASEDAVPPASAPSTHSNGIDANSEKQIPCWQRAWAIDLSAGGIRLRTHELLPARQLYALQFWLPGEDSRAVSHARCFSLRGRVLRSQQLKSRTCAFEAMLGFDRLSAEDGLALSEFLSI